MKAKSDTSVATEPMTTRFKKLIFDHSGTYLFKLAALSGHIATLTDCVITAHYTICFNILTSNFITHDISPYHSSTYTYYITFSDQDLWSLWQTIGDK